MAATNDSTSNESADEVRNYVHEFLNKEFGEDLNMLENLSKVVEGQERLKQELEMKITECKKDTVTKIEESKKNGHQKVTEIDSLLVEHLSLVNSAEKQLSGQEDLCKELGNLTEQIEEINCLQVYLSWILQICHLSKELHSELERGNVAIAVEFCVGIADIVERLAKSSCQNLVGYGLSTKKYWLGVVVDFLSRNMEVLLGEMKWPFPTGISAPALHDNNKDIMPQFDALVNLLLKLHTDSEKAGKAKDSEMMQLSLVLVRPLQKRFGFHFYGSKRTNNIEKPEWYLTQVFNWIRDHTQFLETYIQPLVDKAGLGNHYIQHEFIGALLQTCTEKVKGVLPQMSAKESLFSHLIDEILLFDNELRSLYNYPAAYPGCISALMMEPYLEQWLQLERKCTVQMIDEMLVEERALSCKYENEDNITDAYVPICVENFMAHISIITDRYRCLGDSETQLRFVDLQLFLFEYFMKRMKEMAKMAATALDDHAFFALLNGSQYMSDVLQEWSEQVFYIQLHCAKLQRPSKVVMSTSVRLDDSFIENISDTTIDSNMDNSDLFVDKTLFEDILLSLEEFSSALLDSLMKNIENKLKHKVSPYASEKWHSFPPSKELVTPMISNAACSLLMFAKESLRATQLELCPSLFTKFWQCFARALDSMIYNDVIMQSHFNEGGAMQLTFDMMKNLLLLFEQHTRKPESYFKLIKESCTLITLLPGSAVLLKEVLTMAEKSAASEQNQRHLEAANALSDLGVKHISVPMALRVLCSRIDWPKL